MTESTAPEEPDASEEPYWERREPPDAILLTLVQFANLSPNFEMSITISLPGGTVTGNLIGCADWLRLVKSEVAAASDVFARIFDPFLEAEAAQATAAKDNAPDHPTSRFPRYLHLKDARWFDGAGHVPGDGELLLRVRMSQVSAWTVGSLSFGD